MGSTVGQFRLTDLLHSASRVDERELREFARANLAHFKAPHSVTFVKDLLKTVTGKIQKCIFRERNRPVIASQMSQFSSVMIQRLLVLSS